MDELPSVHLVDSFPVRARFEIMVIGDFAVRLRGVETVNLARAHASCRRDDDAVSPAPDTVLFSVVTMVRLRAAEKNIAIAGDLTTKRASRRQIGGFT